MTEAITPDCEHEAEQLRKALTIIRDALAADAGPLPFGVRLTLEGIARAALQRTQTGLEASDDS